MKKFMLLFFTVLAMFAQGQDVIKIKDGQELKGKIVESTKERVRIIPNGDTIARVIPSDLIKSEVALTNPISTQKQVNHLIRAGDKLLAAFFLPMAGIAIGIPLTLLAPVAGLAVGGVLVIAGMVSFVTAGKELKRAGKQLISSELAH